MSKAELQVEELRAELGAASVELRQLQATCDAANARIVELARFRRIDAERLIALEDFGRAASARADAAERKLTQAQNAHAHAVKDRGFADIQRQRAESEVAALRADLAAADVNARNLEVERDAATALLGRIGVWADQRGAALVPHGGSADTYGDGVRACKAQVKALLARREPTHV